MLFDGSREATGSIETMVYKGLDECNVVISRDDQLWQQWIIIYPTKTPKDIWIVERFIVWLRQVLSLV